MFKDVKHQDRPVPFKNYRGQIEILVDREVYSYILEEISRHPGKEDGGKYIGYLIENGHAGSEGRATLGIAGPAILITDFLPSGPNAKRTAVEFMPDGEYQEHVFRRAEGLDSNVEHLGSWHSHHCNGLERLSGGDIEGYFRTVNKANYRPNFFVASLVKKIPHQGSTPSDWIDHFLFVRGVDDFYRVTDTVRLVTFPTIFSGCTGHSEKVSVSTRMESGGLGRVASADPGNEWYTTEEGRRVLAKDKAVFTTHFGQNVLATRQDSRIALTGQLNGKTISLTYPSRQGEDQIIIYVRRGKINILEIRGELNHRMAALIAAVAAVNSM